jgi:small redox-active disulfide protein 2
MDYKDLKISKMDIKILGTGCPKCKMLESLTRDVVAKNGIDATVSKVEDIMEIMNYGVMTTPALVVNGKVEIKGRVPSAEEIKQLLIK